MDKYLQDIGKEALITTDEEVSLAQRIKQGDEIALEKLCKANLRFVVSVAKQYQNQGLGLPDLINEGNLGLIKAAQRFDETRGFKFISFAVWWIRQSILQALAEQSRIVRLPLNKIGSISKINKASAQLEQQFEREPNADEIATLLDISENEVEKSMENSMHQVSIDVPMDEESPESTWLDLNRDEEAISPDKVLLSEDLGKDLERCLISTYIYKDGDRDAEIVRHFFGLGKREPRTLEEIGEMFDLTSERVRQIIHRTIRRLKHNKNTYELLKRYLG